MNIVLLSGGSGKRLWPLSNDTQSKQFLKLLKDDDGKSESMVQRVNRQITKSYPEANIFVSCNKSHEDMIRRQLGNAEIISEPSRRDTFPAIVLSAAYLKYVIGLDDDNSFIVCPIDVFAEQKYFELLKEVQNLTNSYKIGLLGIAPTYPSAKYGYILQKDGEVSGFTEKPTEAEAENLIAGGALWNCGVFALKIGYTLEKARKYLDFDSFDTFYEGYNNLPKISFDYEIIEKEKSVGAVIYDGIWKDLGTWNTLTEEIDNSIGKNIIISESCKNTHVLNMLDLPVIVQDLQDTVVVASHDGILVTSKHGSSFIKPLAEQVNLRPMYEQRHWGNYRVLDYKMYDGVSSLVKRLVIEKGCAISYQYHSKRSEIWNIIRGKGVLTIDGEDTVVKQGSVVTIPKGAKHSLYAVSELEFIEVQLGDDELQEEDIVRI